MFKLLNLILLLINLATNTLYLLWLCNDIFCCSNENKFLMKFLWHTSNFYSLMSKSCYTSVDLIHLKFWINSINSIVPIVTFFYFKLCLCHVSAVSQYVSYIDQTVFRYVSYRLYLIDTQPYELGSIELGSWKSGLKCIIKWVMRDNDVITQTFHIVGHFVKQSTSYCSHWRPIMCRFEV